MRAHQYGREHLWAEHEDEDDDEEIADEPYRQMNQ